MITPDSRIAAALIWMTPFEGINLNQNAPSKDSGKVKSASQ